MPYTPPAGSAVNFNFVGGYAIPGGSSVVFNFGSTVVPPSSLALPTGLAQARRGDEEWHQPPPRRIGIVPASPAGVAPFRRPPLAAGLFDDDGWMPRPRRAFAPVTYTARVMLFVST